MHKIAVDKGFGVEINAETSGILRSKLPSDFENALGSYGIDDLDQFEALKYDKETNPKGFKDLSHFFLKGTPKQLRTFTNGVVSQYVFNNTFKALENPSSGVSYTQREATGDFLTYLNDNNILNTVGEQYKEGEPVYIRQKISEVPGPKSLSYNEKVYNNLQKGVDNSILFAALTETPAKSKIMYTEKDEKKGVYVMQEGFPTGTALTPKALALLFKP